MRLIACIFLILSGSLLGCADAPPPAAPVALVAQACQNLVVEEVHLSGAVMTTRRCAD